MKIIRKIIEIDEKKCDGCGQCVLACAEGAIEIIDNKAKVLGDHLCDGLGACIGDCPQDALKIVEREAEEFDEAAVEKRIAEKLNIAQSHSFSACPSAKTMMSFLQPTDCKCAQKPEVLVNSTSELTHWPIKIRLIPPTAPFLKNASLLILADCCAVAYSKLHKDFLKGKVVMMGCPKFDDKELYIQRFSEIFQQAGIKHVTTLIMEVVCCSGLPSMVKKGMENAQKSIPIKEIVITAKGTMLSEQVL
ncbi:4Fe-4S ferredoxin, iron-sulpur binding domain-containing protein [Candidatus Magnetomorum sp. HK-1]|nr:4Fe-4S ferredoxin, iron-sulpur binding domain-containing protein [Candidatus Magnetomorum sp. HK-1]